MQNHTVDALVVGAGPVGLTAAAALARQGLKCRIIDKAANPSDKSKALVVWSRTLELLDGFGLGPEFVRTGREVHWANIYGGDEQLVHLKLTGVDSPYDYPLMIPQSDTERLLNEHITKNGLTVERQVELVSFTEQAGSVRAKLRHADGKEEEFEVPWLIGCDGAHSAVRHTLGIEFTGSAEPNDWMLADVHIDGPISSDAVTVYWHSKGILVFFPITETRFRVIADLGTTVTSELRPEPTLEEIQAKVNERGPGGMTLKDPVWLSNFRINERKVSEYYRGRVVLAGDAAHIHSPAGGQGMNTGMQDVFNLAWKLALIHRGDGRADALFNSYTVERSAIGDQVLRGAGMVTLIGTLRNPVAQFFRNHIASVMASFQFVQDQLRNTAAELSVNYRHGPLSAEKWPRLTGGLAAGDRLPDAPLTSAGGDPTTLFAAVRGTRHALLLLPGASDQNAIPNLLKIADEVGRVFPNVLSAHLILKADTAPPNPVPPHVRVWFDPDGRLHQKFHATHATLILVRPDGYIGYRCQPADGAALTQYLGGYLIRKV